METLAPDRVRIRVASADVAAARTVASEIGRALVSQGLRERLRIESETTTGGRLVLLARLVAVLATALKALAATARRLRVGLSSAPAR